MSTCTSSVSRVLSANSLSRVVVSGQNRGFVRSKRTHPHPTDARLHSVSNVDFTCIKTPTERVHARLPRHAHADAIAPTCRALIEKKEEKSTTRGRDDAAAASHRESFSREREREREKKSPSKPNAAPRGDCAGSGPRRLGCGRRPAYPHDRLICVCFTTDSGTRESLSSFQSGLLQKRARVADGLATGRKARLSRDTLHRTPSRAQTLVSRPLSNTARRLTHIAAEYLVHFESAEARLEASGPQRLRLVFSKEPRGGGDLEARLSYTCPRV